MCVSERLWEFKSATLINLVNGTEIETEREGILIVTVVNKQTGEKQNGTVCKDRFNWNTAKLLCLSMEYLFADWGSYPRNRKYISE